MAVGRPLLVGVRGDATELVTRAKAGLACEPEDPASMAEVVEKFQAMSPAELDAMGENGKRFYQQELSIETGTKRYEKVFEAAARRR